MNARKTRKFSHSKMEMQFLRNDQITHSIDLFRRKQEARQAKKDAKMAKKLVTYHTKVVLFICGETNGVVFHMSVPTTPGCNELTISQSKLESIARCCNAFVKRMFSNLL